jgi:hypothetical protein
MLAAFVGVPLRRVIDVTVGGVASTSTELDRLKVPLGWLEEHVSSEYAMK